MLDAGKKVAPRHTIASQLVGHDHPRHILQTLQKPLEEGLRGVGIAPGLNQDVEHNTIQHGTLRRRNVFGGLLATGGPVADPRSRRTRTDRLCWDDWAARQAPAVPLSSRQSTWRLTPNQLHYRHRRAGVAAAAYSSAPFSGRTPIRFMVECDGEGMAEVLQFLNRAALKRSLR